MKDFTQGLIDGLDKTTVDGFAEALMISISTLKDGDGKYIAMRLHSDPVEAIRMAKDVARMMLGGQA